MNLFQYNYQKKIEGFLSTGRKKSYFIAAVTVFFIVLMAIVGIIPSISSFAEQQSENGQRDVIIGKMQNKLDTLKSFVSDSQSKKGVLDFLDNVFPEKFPEKDALNKITELSLQNNLDIQNYSFQPASNASEDTLHLYTSTKTKILSVSIVTDGTLTDIESFIKDMESSSRIFDIVDVSIARKVGDALAAAVNGKDYDLTMNFNIYYFDPTVAATTAP